MEEENEKLIKGAEAARGEPAKPLFSAFRPPPPPAPPGRAAPAGPGAPSPRPPSAQKPSPVPAGDAEGGNARGPEKEMLDYLKRKTAELEAKLRDSQEKALAFAYELKGKEEARKESRREMEEFLAAVKQQQSGAEAERQHLLELQRARERIEALEARLLELSSRPPAPPDPGPLARLEELAGEMRTFSSRLDAAAKEDALEAGKLQAAFKRELTEALGALAERQQTILLKAAEAGRLHTLELQKSRERIEALEARLGEFASRPPAPPDAGLLARLEELAGEIRSVFPRLDAAAKAGAQEAGKLREMDREELAEALGALAAKTDSISSRLDAAAKEDALEAGKLQAAFKRELAEALGALAERQEAILLKAADAGRLHALELQKSRERIEALEARLLEFASRPPAPPDPGLLSRIEALAAELGSFAPRLDAAAKEGSQEAGKLRAAFKRELAEALGAFAGELEGWILQGAKRNRGALPEREFSGPQNGVGDSGPVAAAAAKSGGELTGLVAGRLGEIQAILRKLSSEADAAGPGADKALELLKNARSVTDTMAGSTDAGLLQTLLGYLDKCVAGAVEQLARAQAAAEEAGGLPDVPLKMRVRLHVAALEAAIRSLEGLAAFHASRSRR